MRPGMVGAGPQPGGIILQRPGMPRMMSPQGHVIGGSPGQSPQYMQVYVVLSTLNGFREHVSLDIV